MRSLRVVAHLLPLATNSPSPLGGKEGGGREREGEDQSTSKHKSPKLVTEHTLLTHPGRVEKDDNVWHFSELQVNIQWLTKL